MKNIRLNKSKEYQIGNVRVPEYLFIKIEKLAKSNNVSKQEIVRVLLENFIDEVNFVD